MKQQILALCVILSLCSAIGAQGVVSINDNGAEPNQAAILDIQSDTKGLLIPRVTTFQRNIMTHAKGLLVYDLNFNAFFHSDGATWYNMSGPFKLLDWDKDTKIQVEESPDEDIIRFDVAGVEVMRHDGKTLNMQAAGGSVFIGEGAGSNDDGVNDGVENENTFVGVSAGASNTTGIYNTALGYGAGAFMTIANANVILGHRSGFNLTTGGKNTFAGWGAGYNSTTQFNNVAIGYQAGYHNVESQNQFVGYRAGYQNTSGQWNYFSGFEAGLNTTTGNANHFAGYRAGADCTTSSNHFVGYRAGENTTTGVTNHFTGHFAGGLTTEGSENHYAGYLAGGSNTTGSENTAVGFRAGSWNSTGERNTSVGAYAGLQNTASDNVFVGSEAGRYSDGAKQVTLIGRAAGKNLDTGDDYNTFVGYGVGTNAIGRYNVMIGHTTAQGCEGDRNVIIGNSAVSVTSDGSDLTIVGSNADIGPLNNNVVLIGQGTYSDLNNSAMIGNETDHYGMGIEPSNGSIMRFSATAATLSLGGNWVNGSDVNIKENFTPVDREEILQKVSDLPITEWNYIEAPDSVRHIGPMAQDFHAAFRLGDNNKTISTLDPAGVALVAIQALHDQQLEMDALLQKLEQRTQEVDFLKARLDDMQEQFARIESKLGYPENAPR